MGRDRGLVGKKGGKRSELAPIPEQAGKLQGKMTGAGSKEKEANEAKGGGEDKREKKRKNEGTRTPNQNNVTPHQKKKAKKKKKTTATP